MPKISVLMSVFNDEDYIKEAIYSLIHQTYQDFEIIIIDDGSVDQTASIISSIKDPRIKLYKNKTNEGLTKNLNKAWDLSKGDLIARMDGDDISSSRRFEKQVSFFEQNKDISLLGCNSKNIGANKKNKSAAANHEELKCSLFLRVPFPHSGVMLRKEDFDNIGMKYDEDFKYAQDFDLWVRASRVLKFYKLPEVLLEYRIHEGQASSIHRSKGSTFDLMVRKNQVDELGIHYSEEILKLYNKALSSSKSLLSLNELQTLDTFYCEIIDQNNKKGLYDKETFKNKLGESFRIICIQQLLQKSKNGKYFRESNISKKYKANNSDKLKMMFLGLLSKNTN
ncbi:glycosyltransferase [Halobacillus halophilus]|uniref:glycosyltransferase family 2 protein n=1 Tax=Halobacillus halophilus TaxID=1570 RepID=UPI001370CEDA|nr:glycosyltransferase [Halobacillus halophilus]MYL30781.1 glycosyltransferase [Halobacillus halophilus]